MYIFTSHAYFGEPEGQVKIQMMSKNLLRYYALKCLIRDLLSNVFFPQNSDLPRVLIFSAAGEMRRVQISCDICTSFAHYLYFTKQCWIIRLLISCNLLDHKYVDL